MSTSSDAPPAFPAAMLSEATALLRRGVLLPARGEDAANLGLFLTRGLGLEPAYLEERVQTLLRNGLAVDDFAVPLAAGDRLQAVLRRSEGMSNKDLARFTSQIEALCDKWQN